MCEKDLKTFTVMERIKKRCRVEQLPYMGKVGMDIAVHGAETEISGSIYDGEGPTIVFRDMFSPTFSEQSLVGNARPKLWGTAQNWHGLQGITP